MQLVDRGTKHILVLLVFLRRTESAGSVGKPFYGGLVCLHFLNVIGCEGIVTKEQFMAIEEGVHGSGLNFTNLVYVRGLFVLRRGLLSLGTCFLLLRPISVFLLALRRLASLACRVGLSRSAPFSCWPA